MKRAKSSVSFSTMKPQLRDFPFQQRRNASRCHLTKIEGLAIIRGAS
jgi:hypothetical protein